MLTDAEVSAVFAKLQDKTWKVKSGYAGTHTTLTSTLLRAYYAAIRAGDKEPWLALGVPFGSARMADRANAILKRGGLIRYDSGARAWVAR